MSYITIAKLLRAYESPHNRRDQRIMCFGFRGKAEKILAQYSFMDGLPGAPTVSAEPDLLSCFQSCNARFWKTVPESEITAQIQMHNRDDDGALEIKISIGRKSSERAVNL
jgi:hypothetical protein